MLLSLPGSPGKYPTAVCDLLQTPKGPAVVWGAQGGGQSAPARKLQEDMTTVITCSLEAAEVRRTGHGLRAAERGGSRNEPSLQTPEPCLASTMLVHLVLEPEGRGDISTIRED